VVSQLHRRFDLLFRVAEQNYLDFHEKITQNIFRFPLKWILIFGRRSKCARREKEVDWVHKMFIRAVGNGEPGNSEKFARDESGGGFTW
jgi:hypothetical protein